MRRTITVFMVAALSLSACASEDLDLLLDTFDLTDLATSPDEELARTAEVLAAAEKKAKAAEEFKKYEDAIRNPDESLPEARAHLEAALELDPNNPRYVARWQAFEAMTDRFDLLAARNAVALAEIRERVSKFGDHGIRACYLPRVYSRLRTAMAEILSPDGSDVVRPGPDAPSELTLLYEEYVYVPSLPLPDECQRFG